MKKIMTLVMVVLLVSLFTPFQGIAVSTEEEMRAAWITTIWNKDFPTVKNNPIAQQKEFIGLLDTLQDIGINTVMVQVRPKGDALYASTINPWSEVLTGKQGQYPGYDPLAFMIEEAHKRGMAIHAWLNPYRITTSGMGFESLSELHPANLHPEWVIEYKDALYYNPELEEVKEHIVDSVVEIVKNYDIDGIHFDDYFYPANYPLPEGETRDGEVANARRNHINDMVQRVSRAIKRTNNSIQFGISPVGIWKNIKSDSTGSQTDGGESYYTVCADTRTWIKNEWIDYVVPQIYWETGHAKADYETLVKWWANEVKGTNVKLYIGQGIYKDVVASEIGAQLRINQKYKEVEGSIYFSMKDLIINRQGAADQIKAFYQEQDNTLPTPDLPGTSDKPAPSGDIQLKINETYVKPPVAPLILNGTTLVPLRIVSENLEARVDWEPIDKRIIITNKNQMIELQVGSTSVIVNGNPSYLLTAPRIVNGTTMVPIRFISENLGATVDWDTKQRIITISAQK